MASVMNTFVLSVLHQQPILILLYAKSVCFLEELIQRGWDSDTKLDIYG